MTNAQFLFNAVDDVYLPEPAIALNLNTNNDPINMSKFIDITDRQSLNLILYSLKPGTPALWGKLKPQNMIEHLIEAVQYTNGKRKASLEFALEKASRDKQFAVYSDFEIPRFEKGHLSDASITLNFKDLPAAIDALNKELNDFEFFFKQQDRQAIHQAFGPMNYKEWLIWHGKHFTHHFKQFGLL